MSDFSNKAQNNILECVAFTVSGQIYCLDIMMIREIRRSVSVTKLPHAEAHVLGVINLRGNVIPVYDLCAHFGLGGTVPEPSNVVIITDVGGQNFGLLVESVSEIMTVEKSEVQDTPKMMKERYSGLIEGLIPVEAGMAQLVDLRHLAREGVDVSV